jgi:hypothetical protein
MAESARARAPRCPSGRAFLETRFAPLAGQTEPRAALSARRQGICGPGAMAEEPFFSGIVIKPRLWI